jgi:hypothetical protein
MSTALLSVYLPTHMFLDHERRSAHTLKHQNRANA